MTICWFGNDNLFQPKIFYIHFQVFLSNLDSTQIIYEDNDSLQTLWPIWRYPSPEKLKIYLLPPHLAQAEGLKEGSFFLFLIRWNWHRFTIFVSNSVFNLVIVIWFFLIASRLYRWQDMWPVAYLWGWQRSLATPVFSLDHFFCHPPSPPLSLPTLHHSHLSL